MIGVGKQTLGPGIFQIFVGQGFYAGLRGHRHKNRGMHRAVFGVQYTGAGFTMWIFGKNFKRRNHIYILPYPANWLGERKERCFWDDFMFMTAFVLFMGVVSLVETLLPKQGGSISQKREKDKPFAGLLFKGLFYFFFLLKF